MRGTTAMGRTADDGPEQSGNAGPSHGIMGHRSRALAHGTVTPT